MQKFEEFKRPPMRSKTELFPEYDSYEHNTDGKRRGYVARRLVEMAESGELFLTECLALGDPIRTHVLQAIMGHAVRNKRYEKGLRTREGVALAGVTVKLESLPRLREDGVVWENGAARPNYVESREHLSIKLPAIDSDLMSKDDAREAGVAATDAPMAIPQVMDLGVHEADVPLAEAAMGLMQSGAFVRRARSGRMQHFLWRLREVHPTEAKPEKRGPGRPRKNTE